MKKIFTCILMIAGWMGVASAQDAPANSDDNNPNKLQALYVAYITKELNLSSEEAQKFWPEHTQFDTEVKAVDKKLPELDREQAILNIRKKYQERFRKILGTERTDRFFRKDIEFRRKLAERLRNRIKQRPPVRPRARRA